MTDEQKRIPDETLKRMAALAPLDYEADAVGAVVYYADGDECAAVKGNLALGLAPEDVAQMIEDMPAVAAQALAAENLRDTLKRLAASFCWEACEMPAHKGLSCDHPCAAMRPVYDVLRPKGAK